MDLFVAAGAGHQLADGFFGGFVVVEDGVDLLGDGHLDAVAGGEAEGGGGAGYAFGYFAVQALEDVGELAAAAQFDADGAVAGEGAGAGEDKVAEAGEAGEGLAVASAGYGEAGDLGDAAGDDGGSGVMAEVEAVDDAGGEGDDVFEGAAELYAGDVVVGVDAQGGRGEVALDGVGEDVVVRRRRRGRWGMPAATSCAKDGPERTATGLSVTAAMTWDMRRKLVSSMPLLARG